MLNCGISSLNLPYWIKCCGQCMFQMQLKLGNAFLLVFGLQTNPTICLALPSRCCCLFWRHSIRELHLLICYLQAAMWSISQLHNCRIHLVQTWYIQLNMSACSRIYASLLRNIDTENESNYIKCAYGFTCANMRGDTHEEICFECSENQPLRAGCVRDFNLHSLWVWIPAWQKIDL